MPFLQVLLCHMLTVLFGQMTKIHVFGKMLTPQVLLRPNANPSRSVVPNADAHSYVWSNDKTSCFWQNADIFKHCLGQMPTLQDLLCQMLMLQDMFGQMTIFHFLANCRYLI